MELSHWNLLENFTFLEAACLAGGVDPDIDDRSPAERSRINRISQEMLKAYSIAYWNALAELPDLRSAKPKSKSEDIEFSFYENALPSCELIQEVRSCIRSERDFDTERVAEFAPGTFSREHLHAWFKFKGFLPTYCFVSSEEIADDLKQSANSGGLHFGHQNVSTKLKKMVEAASRFWERADRDDPGTQRSNSEVANWFIANGFSPSLAKKAATIIRPDWAPTGRKPEE